MNVNLRRYELFAWEYEHSNPLTDEAVAWYVKFAHKTGGPVLELACGTGRLLVSIARAGFEIDGIDLSEGMLEIARKRISELAPEIRARIRIHNMDMSDFELGRKFGLIFIADNSFRELQERGRLLRCLRCIHNHLPRGGKLLITERRFDPTKLVDGRRDVPWSEPMRHPATGDLVSRRILVQLDESGKWVSGAMYYRTTARDGSETIEACPFRAPVMLTAEYVSLFAEAGFAAKVHPGYEEKQDDGEAAILCFVCEPSQSASPA